MLLIETKVGCFRYKICYLMNSKLFIEFIVYPEYQINFFNPNLF
jgi:hypothetical protein